MNMKISQKKLSRIRTIDRLWIVRACDIREVNFCKHARIHKIRKHFLRRKFPAIQYKYMKVVIREFSTHICHYIMGDVIDR